MKRLGPSLLIALLLFGILLAGFIYTAALGGLLAARD